MPKKVLGRFVHMDRVIAETSAAHSDFEEAFNDLEEVAAQTLAEQGIPIHTVSVAFLEDGHLEYSERGTAAALAYISIRLVKDWISEAVEKDKATADTLYRVAYHAAIAATTAAVIGPMVTKFQSKTLKDDLYRKKGTEASKKANDERAQNIRSALTKLWEGGARYKKLGVWTNAISDLDPTLAPPKGSTNDSMNKIVSREGKKLFGTDWPK